MDFNVIAIEIHRYLYGVVPPFAAITVSTLLWRLSGSVSLGIFAHLSSRWFVRVRYWCWTGRPGSQSPFQSTQRCSMELMSGLCVDKVHPCLNGPYLCTGAQWGWNRKGLFPNFSHKGVSISLSKMSWFVEALRFPFTGLSQSQKGPYHCLFSS